LLTILGADASGSPRRESVDVRTVDAKLNVALAAGEAAGTRALELLTARDDVRVVLVLLSERGSGAALAEIAQARGCRLGEASRVAQPTFSSDLTDLNVDVLLNVHSLYIAHSAVVAAPTIGSFNLHPGPLPAYPGLNAPSWGIYDLAPSFGCTVHWMDAGIDTGPIAYAARFPIGDRDTGLTLTTRCVREGLPLIARLLDDAAGGGAGRIPRVEQDGERIERGPGPPNEGRSPWSLPAERIAAFVRACDYGPFPSPWGRVRVKLDGADLVVTRATAVAAEAPSGAQPGDVLRVEGDDVLVGAGERTVLRLSRLEIDGAARAAAEIVGGQARFTA
jgi:methionyl-tRNA formyltransferase